MNKNILIIAAHSDDETLGCGGTISKLAQMGHNITALFMTDGISSRGTSTKKEAKKRKENSEHAAQILGISQTIQLDFPDNGMDTIPLLQIIKVIEENILKFQPHTIFTHYLHDLNIDHAIVAKATLTATRPLYRTSVKKVLGYEVNSSTEWAFCSPQFSPNYFVNISETFEKKISAIQIYTNEFQKCPHPRSIEGITGLASLRGNAAGYKYAEAFKIYRFMED